ncbi:TlpA disulfide reductase family protein [Verrucosispora sp. WMMA2121]|uniref:TlpA family protein disulfide reductase n=1 Tax=Verrucosispora sp. WMMA2121 TaxID=3015164 RepID=UPI0022B64D2A|nr:TlpA disulfide reductase family protein [Verrucosispora sp. WMMA2121]MCZ7418848.1 TlpA disulfide reductase family protein [Verrucosispora sp. WMMA2121]
MLYLTAAVVLIGGLSLLNLALSAAIIRRLRDQPTNGGQAGAQGILAAGEAVPQFRSRTHDGQPVTLTDIAPGTVVAFFSPTCIPCQQALPGFLEQVAGDRGAPVRSLAVVVGPADQADDMVSRLAPVTRVVLPTDSEPLVRAFEVTGFPAFFLMDDDHVVRASGHSLSVLPLAVAA